MPWTPYLECVGVSASGTFISLPSVWYGMSRPNLWDTASPFSVFRNAGAALCPAHVGCTLHLFRVLPDRALIYGADFLIRAALLLSRGYVDCTGQASPENLCKCEAALGGSRISDLLLRNKLLLILSDLKQQAPIVSQFLWVGIWQWLSWCPAQGLAGCSQGVGLGCSLIPRLQGPLRSSPVWLFTGLGRSASKLNRVGLSPGLPSDVRPIVKNI